MGLDEKKAVTSSEARGLFINMLRCLALLDMTYMTFETAPIGFFWDTPFYSYLWFSSSLTHIHRNADCADGQPAH